MNNVLNPLFGSVARLPGARWALPTEDEWYKAAYYQPSSLGGDADDYWSFPTATNSAPSIANANGVGDISNPGPNVANFSSSAVWNGVPNVTTVGSAGPASDSFYGTYDQGGNVSEWTEAGLPSQSAQILRGGYWSSDVNLLQSTGRNALQPQDESSIAGFRVVQLVPESSTFSLGLIGLTTMLIGARNPSGKRCMTSRSTAKPNPLDH